MRAQTATYPDGSPDTYHTLQGGLTIAEAAQVAGVSQSTIRRWVKDGKIRSERVHRPQGYLVYVHLSAEQLPTVERGRRLPGQLPEQLSTAPSTGGMVAYTRSLLEPVLAALEQSQERLEQSEARARDQAELIGALRAQLAAAEERLRAPAAHDAQEGPSASILDAQPGDPAPVPPVEPKPAPIFTPEPIPPEPDGQPWWRRWWAVLAGA